MIYLPLSVYDGGADGFVMPAVVYDSDEAHVRRLAEYAVSAGARFAILSNAGQEKLIRGLGLRVTAGFRYNVCNTESALAARDAGAELVTVSPETTAAQIADIAKHVRASATVYGRIPLMMTERCIIRAVSGDKCICGMGPVTLRDRRSVAFPMYKTDGCGTVIYNSTPTYMGDRADVLRRIGCAAHHFIFTAEDQNEVDGVIALFEEGGAAPFPVRRIK